jgi:hypothetical protein
VLFDEGVPLRDLRKATPLRTLHETEDLMEADYIAKLGAVQKLREK